MYIQAFIYNFFCILFNSTIDRQEIDRMQKVIKEVYTCLCDLKLAIDGTIVMSPALKESLDAMYDARIPESWMKVRNIMLSIQCCTCHNT